MCSCADVPRGPGGISTIASVGDVLGECTAMTAYTASVRAGSPSPTCGHVYARPSLSKGAYTVTATANWVVNWSTDGLWAPSRCRTPTLHSSGSVSCRR